MMLQSTFANLNGHPEHIVMVIIGIYGLVASALSERPSRVKYPMYVVYMLPICIGILQSLGVWGDSPIHCMHTIMFVALIVLSQTREFYYAPKGRFEDEVSACSHACNQRCIYCQPGGKDVAECLKLKEPQT